MKKTLILFALIIFSSIAVFAQAEDDETKNNGKKTGFSVFSGDVYSLESGRLANYRNIASNPFSTNGIDIQVGTFKSNEDGLLDFISGNYGGLYFGQGSAKNNFSWKSYGDVYTADDFAKFGSVYSRNEIGLQVNFLCLSFAGFIGLRSGYDLLYQSGVSSSGYETSIFEHTFYAEAISGSYISVNIGKGFKIIVKYTTDLFPILNVKFDTSSYGYHSNTTVSETNWFGPIEFDNSLVIGAVFFF